MSRLKDEIRRRMSEKETDDLLAIWVKNDKVEFN